MSTQSCMTQLGRMARQWGGNIVKLSAERFKAMEAGRETSDKSIYAGSPFDFQMGIEHAAKRVVYCAIHANGIQPVKWGNIVHEMGHVFCTNEHECEDETVFLGWEWSVAKLVAKAKLDIDEWFKHLGNYSIGYRGSLTEFSDLSDAQRTEVLANAVERSTRHGLIVNGVPVSIRG